VNGKSTIRKVLFITVWLCIAGGMLTLLLAAISKKNKGRCSGYVITLKGDQQNLFIDKTGVEHLVMKASGGKITGAPIASINMQVLEHELENNTWIRDAELYFDNKDVLHITVNEKIPAARIFTTQGNSFYIDSLGRKMPLSDKMSARVPVFTGFPGKKTLTARDSVLLDQVRITANYIMNDPFWMAQVAQVDITSARTFEMIPVVGNHTVRFGSGEKMDEKFRRLFVFYKQVMSRTGFDSYKLIDVQYKGQVVASKQDGNTKIDSVQLRKNVEKLLRQSRESYTDTTIQVRPLPGKPIVLEADSSTLPMIDPKTTTLKNADPNTMKTTSLSTPKKKTGKNPASEPVEKKKEPKAVMPARTGDPNSGYNE
jgi:cell division protein FtsQ